MSISIRRTLCASAIISFSVFAAGHVAAAGADNTPFDGADLPFGALPGDPLPPEPPAPQVNPDLDLPDVELVAPTLPPEPPLPPQPPDPEVNPNLGLPDLDLVNPTLPPDPPPCGEFDPDAFGITMADNGDGTAFVQIGYFDTADACDAQVDVTSSSTNADGSVLEVYATRHTSVDELEDAALGDGWMETNIELDPCFAHVAVAVEGTVLDEEDFGQGCSITITKDFAGDPWSASINLVHVDGWTPDHVLDVSADDVVVWDELPSGDYTVSEFAGYEDGTTISIDGGAPMAHAGEAVPVSVGQSVLVTNPDITLDLTAESADDGDDDGDDGEDDGSDDGTGDGTEDGEEPGSTVPDRDLPTTGSSMTGLLAGLGLLSGLGGVGCTAIARRRR
jgi:hypothetical protein